MDSQQYPVQEAMIDIQEQPLPNYQCDSIIHDYHFIIESPEYPAQYPVNRICSYYIGKNRTDVCQIELTISDMDIEDTAQCTGDYLDLGITSIQPLNQTTKQLRPQPQQGERLCGLMLRNTRRILNFPPNASHIRLTFHSDSKNNRPYRGFSAEIQQIPGSCSYVNHSYTTSWNPQYPFGSSKGPVYQPGSSSGGGSYPTSQIPINIGSSSYNPAYGYKYPAIGGNHYSPQQPVPGTAGVSYYPQQQPYPMSGQYPMNTAGQYPGYHGQQQPYPTTGINTGYGQRLYPPQHPLYNNRPSIQDPSGVIYQNADKIPGSRPAIYPGSGGGDMKSPYDRNRPSSIYPHSNTTVGPIYLLSYCDVYLGEYQGEIRSPGYPFGYPVNHTCMYTIKKAKDDVCGLELIFHHFDVQTPNTQKDLTDNCHGDYLLLPDGERLCGYYTQSMSGDYKLKKYFEFPETSEYVFMQFISDGQQIPDGSGFWIEVKQLSNSCKTSVDYPSIRCDRIISGKYSQVDRIYSPGFPQYYGKRQQCVYFVQPMDDKTCEFELDLVQFSLEQPLNNPQEECRKDYLQLPDRKRICGHHKFRRIFQFPKYHDRTSMFYFHSDDQIEDRGYEIVVRQSPNSCDNYNYNISGQSPTTQPWNTNVYVPSNDPNIPPGYVPPTPVFTFDNSTGGLQPYQPPLRPGNTNIYPGGPNVIKIGPGEFGRKNLLPSAVNIPGYPTPPPYWMNTNIPNNLNDPRNVDSSGTIPLFYANGTLATRIPPMKPVDMIPYLKKGKTIIQKDSIGRSFTIHTPQDMNAVTFNRIPNVQPDEPEFQSSARIQQSPKIERLRSFDQMPAAAVDTMNIMPVYNCDQSITRPVEYIRSPNFPNNYPVVTRCIYSILKSDTSVCQIRLHLLSLDLEYTSGCRNDYLHIEPTGEKLCGRFSQPEVRVINYYGYSRDIRLIFNSDREITSTGFEVRIEQIPNSCNEQRPNVTTLNAMVITLGRQFQQKQQQQQQQNQPSTLTTLPLLSAVTSSPMSTPSLDRLRTSEPVFASSIGSQDISPQALINMNQTTSTTLTPGMLSTNSRVCKTTTAIETYFESDNFPLEYPSNLDCSYRIFRANRNVCRLEIDFEEFNVGDENYYGPDGNQRSSVRFDDDLNDDMTQRRELQRNRPIGECLNDFIEIDGIRYCGQRSGQQVAINFPKFLNEIPIRFISVNSPHVSSFNGFRLKVRQIDQNCRTLSSLTSRSNNNNDVEMEDEFGPAIVESCPKLSTKNSSSTLLQSSSSAPMIMVIGLDGTTNYIDPSSTINEELVKIQSPQFSLPSQLQYEPFLDCNYVIQKVNKNICALEIRFELFSLEQSFSCEKDYLQINRLKLCGKIPMDTTRVFEFLDDQMIINFHTDSDQQEKGFAMILKQIRC
nr:uncharacterized protein LOC124490751 [Dermatophagoides farinae]